MFLYQLTLLPNNHLLMSFLSDIYLESRLSCLGVGIQKNIEKEEESRQKRNIGKWREKSLRMQKKSNNINKHFVFIFYVKKYVLLETIAWKKALDTITFYLQFLCVAGYLKRTNDTPKVNTQKYRNHNLIEININELSTTTQIFIAVYYLILMSEKYLHFSKTQKNVARIFFSHPV